jgi:hypothetical protein
MIKANYPVLSFFLVACSLTFAQPAAMNANILASVFESSNLPLIVINTGGNAILEDQKIDAFMGIINNQGSRNYLTDIYNEYDGKIGIEIRGSSSSQFPKKGYSVETRNTDNSNNNISLLGLTKNNDWVFSGPYSDKTLIRNALAYTLGNSFGRWAPHTCFCELFLNEEYQGVYIVTEKIKRDSARVNISKLNPDEIYGDDLTGGYIIKIDRPDECWLSDYTSPVGNWPIYISYVYPQGVEVPQIQKDYIHAYVDEFEDVLASQDFKDPSLGYRKYIDSESFIDFFFLTELSRNVDGYRLSTYLYKDKDSKGGKLTMGPFWDFDLAFGNADYYQAFQTTGWMLHTVSSSDGFQAPFWWDRLREDPNYNISLKTRWEFLRNSTFSIEYIETIIDSFATYLNEAQNRNFIQYPILGTYVWPNYFIGASYESEIQYMKDWIQARIVWIDGQMDAINVLEEESPPINPLEISVYPNPFTDQIDFEMYLLKDSNLCISIFDAIGKELKYLSIHPTTGFFKYTLELPTKIFPKGIYHYHIVAGGKLIMNGNLVKE